MEYNTNIKLYEEIKNIIKDAKKNIVSQVNNTMVIAYWNIGKIIVEEEQNGNDKAQYGKYLINTLSKELTKSLGRGYSKSNLKSMRKFYLKYEKSQTLSGQLTWSHYLELLEISDSNIRSFYEKETVNCNWSVRELRR